MKLKKFAASLLCVLLVLTSGCRKKIEIKEEPKDQLAGNITIWSNKDSVDLLKLAASNYNKINNKVLINIVETEPNELLDKLQLEMTSKGNIPDIVCVDDEIVQKLLKKQVSVFEDTGDDLKKENYLKYKIENLSFEGKLYGFPLSVKPAVMVFRKDIIEKKAINLEYIKTWEDYIALKLSSALPFGEERLYRAFLNQLSGSYFDKEGKLEINSPKALRALETIKKLYASGTIKNVKDFKEIPDLLKKGEIDSALISTESLGSINKELPELKTKLLVIKPPAFEEGGNQAISLGGLNLMLISTSKNKSLSLDFVKFAAENRDNLKSIITELEDVPAYTGYNDEKGFGIKLFLGLAKELNGINYTSDFSEVKPALSDALSNIIIKGQDVKNTLDELQKNLPIPVK